MNSRIRGIELQLCLRTTLLNLIKLCEKENRILEVRRIHADVLKKHLIAKDAHIATALITTYAKRGALEEAREVFDQISVPDVVSWTALISSYAQNGFGHEALKCFRHMQNTGVRPNAVTYISVLKACSIIGSLDIGESIVSELRKQGLWETDIVLGNSMIHMYCKCGALDKAIQVFQQLPDRDIVSWTALIDGHVSNGLADEALECFRKMQNVGVSPNAVTYICILKACGITGCLEVGAEIDREVRRGGLLQKNVLLGTALVDMYSKCGSMEKARKVFEQLPEQNVVTWSALIGGYSQNGIGDEAIKCFELMKFAGIRPDEVTFVSVLKACGIAGSLDIGEDIHKEIRMQGLLQKNTLLGSALVDMYSKCGSMEKAKEVFQQLPVPEVVSWSALIAGYIRHGLGNEAIECFRKMKDAGIPPDPVSYVCVLQACSIIGCLETGKSIHADIRNQGLLHKNVLLSTALVDMYAKCGALEKAQEIFEQLPVKDVVTWSSIISGYTQNGLGDEALKCFRQMQDEGYSPDSITYICILKACGMVGCLDVGEKIHADANKQGLLPKDDVLGTALVDMYSKCGAIEKAWDVFESFKIQDVVSWNALIAGYAHVAQTNVVLDLCARMMKHDIVPNSVTFVVLLNACSHAGLIKEGELLFNGMYFVNCLTPTLEHYTCMIDLYGRAGQFAKMNALLEEVTDSGYLPVFQNILGSSVKWSNVELGRWAFEKSVQLDEKCALAYVYMRNISAATEEKM